MMELPTSQTRESPEVRFGTWWVPRIGIVLLLTALIFYAGALSSAWKVILLYAASGALAGAGLWLARKKEALQNYSRILIAGGLAAIYFTTFAAHYFSGLRVIPNPFLAGALLLGCTGLIIWLADRQRSQSLATLAVGLAWYTTFVVLPISAFTLWSHLVLACAAVV
nr:DUF2339 domain-containing protein [Verrucomicrobiota bacterium]